MEKISKSTQQKLAQLQMLQQRMQLFASQKQAFQLQLLEIEAALAELDKVKEPVYRLVGQILVQKDAGSLKQELSEKKSNLDIRIKSLEKQEEATMHSAQTLQQELTAELKPEK